jgi:hypothetical protein
MRTGFRWTWNPQQQLYDFLQSGKCNSVSLLHQKSPRARHSRQDLLVYNPHVDVYESNRSALSENHLEFAQLTGP